MKRYSTIPATLLLPLVVLNAPLSAEESKDEAKKPDVPAADASQAEVAEGFRAEVLVRGLDFPSSLEVGDMGELYIGESGWAAGGPGIEPRILS